MGKSEGYDTLFKGNANRNIIKKKQQQQMKVKSFWK